MATPGPSISPAVVAAFAVTILSEGCSRHYEDMVGWVVFGCVVAFTTAMGIGANDVANAFSTSVGTGTISLKQAVLIAAVFEFLGAVLVGKGVTKTVKKKIIDPKYWEEDPEYLMLGCVSTLIGCSVWLGLATKLKMPVSTTHTVVGGLLGFALFTKPDAIRMNKLTLIFISWVSAPVMSGVVSAFCFFVYRALVLRKENSLEVARKSIGVVIGIVFFVGFAFIFIKGPADLKKEMNDADGDGTSKEGEDRVIALCWALLASIVCTLPMTFLLFPKIYEKVSTCPLTDFPWHMPLDGEKKERVPTPVKVEAAAGQYGEEQPQIPAAQQEEMVQVPKQQQIVQVPQQQPDGEGDMVPDPKLGIAAETDEGVVARAEIAERFDDRTEGLVSYLQVVTAAFDCFAHGANDTANSIGPFATLWSLYRHGKVKDDVPIWIMIIGGGGLVVGLLFFGQNIIRAIGSELVRITPSRGVAIETASAAVVIFCSAMEIPTSTTHCQVGATLGVGLLEGKKDSINLKLMLKIFFGWVITLVIAGLTSGVLYLMLKEIVCGQRDHTHPEGANHSHAH